MKVIPKIKCVSMHVYSVFGMDKPSNFNKIRLKSHKDDHLHLIRPNLELDVSNITKRVKFKTDSDGLRRVSKNLVNLRKYAVLDFI